MSSEDVATDLGQNEAAAQSAPVPQERMISQSEVDKIVHAKIMRERERSVGGMQQAPNAQASGYNEEELLEKMSSRMQKQQDEQRQQYERDQQKAQVDEIAKTYLEKMEQGNELYDDFKEVTEDFSPATYPQITIMASQYDNLPDIMYELNKNPRKLVDLHVLALTDPPRAKKEMAKLSQSIKQNETALVNNSKSPAPLSRMKSSSVAGQDNGKKTIKDLRKEARFRG